MNLPNRLTVIRLLLIPVFLVVATMESRYADYAAAIVFGVAVLTDCLDGYFARKKKQETVLGKFMDPLADKILISTALIILVEMGRIPGWVAAVIIGREFAVTGLRTVAASEGLIIPANLLGKVKTVTQVVAIIALFIKNYPFSLIGFPFGNLSMFAAVVFTLWSGTVYFTIAWKQLDKSGR
ncbi:MAG TPA: CDP-diacylglycerol--glycerol-3-phosphate 3-phosphatidyltransferase [Bacillota bacterium]|nr:CDP-diacylglycerol--glycerol-3-phosphate 3-phosphatidyltransferase [Bacillota bacterium]